MDRDGGGAGGRRTLRIDLSWRGERFAGWQSQPGLRTVQGELESVLGRLLGEPVRAIGSGRTDRGTHAWHHVSSVRTASGRPAAEIEGALEALLPADIGVLAVRDAEPSFHAQRDAQWKWYRYRVLVGRHRQPLGGTRAWVRARVPDRDALRRAVEPFRGRHDFASFANLGSSARTTVRTIHAIGWTDGRADDGEGAPFGAPWLGLDVVGDGFLYKMVRTIVGTAWRSAAQEDPAESVRTVLAARDRRAAGPAAPADGLTLMAVAMRGDPPPPLPGPLIEAWSDPPPTPGGGGAASATDDDCSLPFPRSTR